MVTRPIVANAGVIPQVNQVVIQESESKPPTWMQRLEFILRRAFGEDEEIIASSLRGF